jgi:hypothetical protein
LCWQLCQLAKLPAPQVHFFDPSRARVGRSVTLTESQVLDNVLEWLEAK